MNRLMNDWELKSFAQKLARQYGATRVYYSKALVDHGAHMDNRTLTITISQKLFKEALLGFSGFYKFMSYLLHEIGHVYCIKHGIWAGYHYPKTYSHAIQTALKAERWVDTWAACRLLELYPHAEFHYSYTSDEDVKWFYADLKDALGA
jgi:hypothetical protein